MKEEKFMSSAHGDKQHPEHHITTKPAGDRQHGS